MSPKLADQAQEILGEVFKRVPAGPNWRAQASKEVVHALLSNAEKVRQGILGVFTAEIHKAFSKVDVNNIVTALADNYTLRLNAELTLVPKKKTTKPSKGKTKRK